jgi:nitrogen PTS system EIIA component
MYELMFGHTLRMLRTTAGISLRTLAKKIDVSPAYLSQIELGKLPPPTHYRITKIAETIGIPVSLLKEMSHRLNPETDSLLRGHQELNDLIKVISEIRLESKEISEIMGLMRILGGDGFCKLIHYGKDNFLDFIEEGDTHRSFEDTFPSKKQLVSSEITNPHLVFKQLEFKNKSKLLRFLIEKVGIIYNFLNTDHIYNELMIKEAETSSGLGNGAAIPHLFVDGLDQTIISVARIPKGIDFSAIDDKPVFLVCLMLSNPDSHQRHLNLLAYFARKFQMPSFIDDILMANSKKRILSLLIGADLVSTN